MGDKMIERVTNFLKELPVHPNQQLYVMEKKQDCWTWNIVMVRDVRVVISQDKIYAEIVLFNSSNYLFSIYSAQLGVSVFLTEEEARKKVDEKNKEIEKLNRQREEEIISSLKSMSPQKIIDVVANCLQGDTCKDCPFDKYEDCKSILAKTCLRLKEKTND